MTERPNAHAGVFSLQKKEAVMADTEENRAELAEPVWKPTLHEWAIMLTLAMISLMISLDATVIITSLQTIVTDLHMTTTQGFWIGTSYLLACAVIMPFTASLSEIFGRPLTLLASLAFFSAGTIACCVAHTAGTLLAGRCIQGIGGSGVIILSLVILTDIVPLRFRPKYFGVIQGAWAIGTCIGPLLGGVIVKNTTWRWVFYLMFPFCAIGFVTVPSLLTLKPRNDTFVGKLKRVDWFGGFLFISSITAFLIAISWGGTEEPWGSFRTLVPLLFGIFGVAAALVWEAKFAAEPFLRRSLFYCRSSYAGYFGAMIQGLLLYGQLYYFPFFFLSVKAFTPVHTGVALFPVLFTLVPSSILVGVIITRVNGFRGAIWAGWLITTLASGLAILWDAETPTGAWVVIFILLGVGHGLLLNAQNFATQAICPPREEAFAAGMYAFLRTFGSAVGVGIGGSLFQNVMKARLRQLHLPEAIAGQAEAYIAQLHALPDDASASPLKEGLLAAYVHGFRGVFAGFCGIAGLAGLASLFLKHYDLNRKLQTEHTLEEARLRLPRSDRNGRVPPSKGTSRAPTPDAEKSGGKDGMLPLPRMGEEETEKGSSLLQVPITDSERASTVGQGEGVQTVHL